MLLRVNDVIKVVDVVGVLLDQLLELELVFKVGLVVRIVALGLKVCSPVNRSYG